MIKWVWEDAKQPYDQLIEEFLDSYNRSGRKMPKTETVFYKFIIPEDEKPNILKELYSKDTLKSIYSTDMLELVRQLKIGLN